MRLPYTSNDLGWFACFRIQFLSDHIMIHSCLVRFLWWPRHGAIGPSEATSFVGLMSTDLTSEFTHFNLVIRLSKVQQMALLLSTVFEESRCPGGPRVSRRNACLPSAFVLNSQKLRFSCSFSFEPGTWHEQMKATGMSFSCRCGLFGFWWGETCCAPNSLELDSRFMPSGLTWTRACCGTIARSIGLGTESCFLTTCFGFVCHQLVPHLVPNSPRVPLRNVSWGLGVCAVLGQVRLAV